MARKKRLRRLRLRRQRQRAPAVTVPQPEAEAEELGQRIDAGTLPQGQAAGLGAMIGRNSPPVRRPKLVDYPAETPGVGTRDPLTGAEDYTTLDMGRFKRQLTGPAGSTVVDESGNIYRFRGGPHRPSGRVDPVRRETVNMIRSGSVPPTPGERDWPFTHVPYRGKPFTMTPDMDEQIATWAGQDKAAAETEALEIEAQGRLMQTPGLMDNLSPQAWRRMLNATVEEIRAERGQQGIAEDTARRGEAADVYRTARYARGEILDAGLGPAEPYTPGRDVRTFKGLTDRELSAGPEEVGEIAIATVARRLGVDEGKLRHNLASSSPNVDYRNQVLEERHRIEIGQAEARQATGGRPATRQQMLIVNDPAQAFRELSEKLQRVSFDKKGKVKRLARKQVRREISEAISMLDPQMIEGLTDADKGELAQLVRAGRQGTVAQPEHLLQAMNNILRRINPARAEKQRQAERKLSREQQETVEKEGRVSAEWDRRQAVIQATAREKEERDRETEQVAAKAKAEQGEREKREKKEAEAKKPLEDPKDVLLRAQTILYGKPIQEKATGKLLGWEQEPWYAWIEAKDDTRETRKARMVTTYTRFRDSVVTAGYDKEFALRAWRYAIKAVFGEAKTPLMMARTEEAWADAEEELGLQARPGESAATGTDQAAQGLSPEQPTLDNLLAGEYDASPDVPALQALIEGNADEIRRMSREQKLALKDKIEQLGLHP